MCLCSSCCILANLEPLRFWGREMVFIAPVSVILSSPIRG